MDVNRVVLLLCGSFDPPTNMHFKMFEMARNHLHGMGPHIVIGGVISPVHDSYSRKELTPSKHRLAMVDLSLQNRHWIHLSTWECRQNGWTSTLSCLQYHQNILNSLLCKTNDVKNQIKEEDLDWVPDTIKFNFYSGPITIKLLCEVDLLETFTTPGIWNKEEVEAIVDQFGLVVINREGSNPNKLIHDSDILLRHEWNIIIVSKCFPNKGDYINIRRALRRNECVKSLMDDSVIDYIYQHDIYMPIKEKSTIDQTVLDKLDASFAKLAASDSKSLLKKYLTMDVFNQLKTKTTYFGGTLLDVIQFGVDNLDTDVGVYAPDAESYTVFADLFDPIIEDYHGGFKKTDKHPPMDFGDVSTLSILDPMQEYIMFSSMRCRRALKRYPFGPCMTVTQLKDMEDVVLRTVTKLRDEFQGIYYPYNTKDDKTPVDGTFIDSARRFWPTGRGVFNNPDETFFVYCNDNDHLLITTMQKGGNLGKIYHDMETAVNEIGNQLHFSHSDRLGFLTLSPTNLGTAFFASVDMKLPKLAANEEILEEVVAKFNLHFQSSVDIDLTLIDISNKRTLGLTEYQIVKEFHDGISEIIKIESEL